MSNVRFCRRCVMNNASDKTITFDENGYMNISFPKEEPGASGEEGEALDGMTGDNPFVESDLPLSQLAEGSDDTDHPDSTELSPNNPQD